MIQFESVYKRYPQGHEALKNLSFSIQKGEMVFLTGHSGAGKSTLLKLIASIEQPTHGLIRVAGENISRISPSRIPALRRQVGMIFQDHQLLPERTVFDNVALPLLIQGLSDKEIGRRVRAALDKVRLLHKEKACPIALSGGEQQRVGIARAIVNKPPVILADEPTGNLDPVLAAEIMALFQELNQVGVALLIATHNIELISSLHYRTLSLSAGRLIEDSTEFIAI
jgi:cell division transport system ATP-binding protein